MNFDLYDQDDIYRLAEELKMPERKVIDFSSTANPLGVSKKIKAEMRKHLKYLDNYPDTSARRLRKRLGQFYGIDPGMILCGNGSTELVYLIAKTLKPQNVLITEPTFSEYERACQISCGTRVTGYRLRPENIFDIDADEFIKNAHSCDMVFFCNPNNTTGRLIKRETVKRIADAAREMKCYLIVDEAFMDFCPDHSVIQEISDNPYLIVLRTMSHFYALPGLRIGYGIFPHHLIGILEKNKEPRTVNILAQRAACVALKDKAYRKETMEIINAEKSFFEKKFKKLGIEYFSSEANFCLLKMRDAYEVYQRLKAKGILVMNCSHIKGLDNTYLRITVRSHRENVILIKELLTCLLNSG